MFDDNHIDESDLLIRSILGDAREDVPEHVWEGVTGRLDRISGRRAVVLWMGRAVAAAAAAAVAVGVFFRDSSEEMVMPEAEGDMIAVVEETTVSDGTYPDTGDLMANVESTRTATSESATEQIKESDPETVQEYIYEKKETVYTKENGKPDDSNAVGDADMSAADDIDWKEDEVKRKRVRASLVISGIAGTNNPQNGGHIGPFRSQGIMMSPEKTTITRNSQSTYGIPVSLGVGARLAFSERWSLGIGVNYSLLTSEFSGKYTRVEDGVASLPIEAQIRNSLHYIGIPINAYYNIINHNNICFYAYAGGTVEKCVANRYEVQTSPIVHHDEKVKGVQLSANAGIGVEFMLGRYAGIYIDPSLRYYFQGNQPKSIRTAQPLMFGFEIGLRFRL